MVVISGSQTEDAISCAAVACCPASLGPRDDAVIAEASGRHASNRRSLCLWDFVEPELIAGRGDEGMDWAKKESHAYSAKKATPLLQPGTKSVVIPVRGSPLMMFPSKSFID